jgi:hypothetical protein
LKQFLTLFFFFERVSLLSNVRVRDPNAIDWLGLAFDGWSGSFALMDSMCRVRVEPVLWWLFDV